MMLVKHVVLDLLMAPVLERTAKRIGKVTYVLLRPSLDLHPVRPSSREGRGPPGTNHGGSETKPLENGGTC